MSLAEILAARKAVKEQAIIPVEKKAIVEVQKEEVVEAKPLTFLQKLELKKKQDAEAKQKPAEKVVIQAKIAEAITIEVAKQAASDNPEYDAASPEIKESYDGIKHKIDALNSFLDGELAEPMSELKRALLANPNACLLMLDEDIGKMTIALRRLVQESLVDIKEKKATKSKKTTAHVLTEEEMNQAFEDL